jgi:hypothetical protein
MKMVNGLVYDFESIKLMLPTGLTLGAESVEYGDEKGDEVISGSNGLPLGVCCALRIKSQKITD